MDLLDQWGQLQPAERWLPYFIAVLHWSEVEVALRVCRKYNLSKRQTEKVQLALKGWREAVAMIWKAPEGVKTSQLAKVLLKMPRESYPMLLAILEDSWIKARFRQLLNIIMDSKPKINGKYIKSLGYRPGPVYREALDALWRERLDGNLRTEEDERQFLRDYLDRVTKGESKC